jgi:hypothetical protein
MRHVFYVTVSTLLLAGWCQAQLVQIPEHYQVVKAENGLIMGWQMSSEDRTTRQISVYDRNGMFLTGLSPLRLVSEAKSATVWDVSALAGHMIAVAVDYRESDDTVASSLLYFSFRGDPILALSLDASREVRQLTVDGDSNVWTLTMGAGERNPSEQPMAVGYGPSGEVLKEVAKRSEFPADSSLTQEGERIGGQTGFGHSADSVWFWLPSSKELVTFKMRGTSPMSRFVTGFPEQSPREGAFRVFRTDAGTLLAWVWGREDDRSPEQFNFFSRSASRKQWEFYAPPCSQCSLIGVDGGKALFLTDEGGQSEIYEAPAPD